MPQVDDLSRFLVALDQHITVTVVVELSQSSLLVAGLLPGVARQPLKKLEPDPALLSHLRERWLAESTKAGRTIIRVTLAYEAGRNGF
jgi:transposase